MSDLMHTDRRTVISGLAVGVTGIVLPTRAAAASGDGGSGPTPTAAYEPRVDFVNQPTGGNLDVYIGWGSAYSTYASGSPFFGAVSGVTSGDKSDFDYSIVYTTISPEAVQTATGSSINGHRGTTISGVKTGTVVTVTITSKTTAGSTNPAGVERTFTHTR